MDTREKIAYLKGLAEGLKIEGDSKLLLSAVIDVLEGITAELDDIIDDMEELQDEVDAISDDLDDLTEELEDGDFDEEDDDDEDDDDDEEIDGYIEFVCPHCGRHILFDIDSFNADGDHKCSCGAALFTDEEDDEDDE